MRPIHQGALKASIVIPSKNGGALLGAVLERILGQQAPWPFEVVVVDSGSNAESATSGLPAAPAIRAIATHPEHPDTVYVGTQDGPYRSDDHGDHWEKLDVPDHGLPVWSLAFDPRNSHVMYAGYENCEIYRSDDGGLRWRQLPVTVRFPEVTVAAGSNPAVPAAPAGLRCAGLGA